MRLLCAADLHLGRQPSRVPQGMQRLLPELGPAAAWRRLVDLALAREVAAVLLAGDVLDDDNDFYEAFNDLRSGVERLVAAGIEVVAVAGNHDVTALPRLARLVPGMRLLGAGGTWESVRIAAGAEEVTVLGWSFPEAVVTSSPVASLDLGALGLGSGLSIGLLHADLDQASRFAPVTTTELVRQPVAAWLLGHVHKPHALGDVSVGYLGSLAAADPGEAGPRGAWLVNVADGELEFEHVSLSPLRYERVTVDLSTLEELAELDALVLAALEAAAFDCQAADGGLLALGCRLELHGRSRFAAAATAQLSRSGLLSTVFSLGGVDCFVHDLVSLAQPELDLEELAAGSGPLAVAARAVLTLRGPASPERRRMLEEATGVLAAVAEQSVYQQLASLELDEELVGGILEEAALLTVALMQDGARAAEEGPGP